MQSNQKPEKKEEVQISELNKYVKELAGRMRLIEERVGQTRDKIRITDENMLSKTNELKESIKVINLRVGEIEKNVKEITETLQRMLKQLSRAAKLNDVRVLEKALDYFDPTNFLTEKDVIKIINQHRGGGL